ncbi:MULTISPECIES: hypothetical protein [Oligella]|uniref:Uncharacterized protein n=1 Tax=Oligella urethralis TaxID=90245 RepID=A0A2X1WKI0_9BURK|nr:MULTISPECIES: hypothetical protein [Oligella]OFS84138.1 hypothetical protein HMPREF3144_07510 [Oligella sp. HMSC05A10]OFV46475.1 hypothetical protein HMPREF3179_09965 [Oligella sp. HMSC09E12]SPY07295.1 Uncharacterised protein [Oligella urethralis]SUA54878.1 Uncharacterised protein [Oligella urethralis]SUA94410.1 Uncharacterised protein [Oligella urethralis]
MLLERNDRNMLSGRGAILVTVSLAVVMFFIRCFNKPVKRNLEFLIKLLTFVGILTIFMLINLVFGKYSLYFMWEFWLIISPVALFLVFLYKDSFPIWIDKEELIRLWQKDHCFLAIEDGFLEIDEDKKVLLEEELKRSGLQEPQRIKSEILSVCNTCLEPLSTNDTTKRYTILPRGCRLRLPTQDEIYWITESTLLEMRKHPVYVYKFLRFPISSQETHFDIYEIQPKLGMRPLIFQGTMTYGDKHWRESKYTDVLFYEKSMDISIILNRQEWTEPKWVGQFYVGI